MVFTSGGVARPLALLLALAACGGSSAATDAAPPNEAPWTSGTRLRAILDVAGDASVRIGWHDVARGEDCGVVAASDLAMRCLPQPAYFAAAYTDAVCTVPVAEVSDTPVTTGYVREERFACGRIPALHRIGAVVTPAPATIYRWSGASCVGGPPTAGSSYVGLGTEVPAASFVKLTEVSEPRDASLAATVLVGEDGTREITGVTDRARAMPCFAFRTQTRSFCEPSEAAFLTGDYGDAGCTMPAGRYAVAYQARCAHPPDMVIDFQDTPTLFERGAMVTALYAKSGASCVAEPVPAGSDYYLRGAPVSIDDLVQLTETQEGSGRMQLRLLRSPLGGLAGSFGYYDTQNAVACDDQQANDGLRRCVPDGERTNQFTDPACTIAIVERGATQAAPAPGTLVLAPWPAGIAAYRTGAKIATPLATYQQLGTMCQQTVPDVSGDYYATTAVPPTDFVPMTLAIE